MSPTIFVLVVNDRHFDTLVCVFDSPEKARDVCREWVASRQADAQLISDVTRTFYAHDKSVELCLEYGTEGDRAYVLRKALNDGEL